MMEHKNSWRGEYRNIKFEIQKFMLSDKDAWAYYLFINENQLEPEDFKKFWLSPKKDDRGRVHYNYTGSFIDSIEFHHGCTFYDKISGIDKSIKAVKIGCDYSHFWDEGHFYNEIMIEEDVKTAIDSLYEFIPKIKKWCCHCGVWFYGETALCVKCEKKREEEKKEDVPC